MAPFTIQILYATDTQLAAQLIELWQNEHFNIRAPLPSETYLHELLLNPAIHVVVALQDDHVIGGCTAYQLPMITSVTNEMFLYDIMVHPSFQRLGVATKLIETLIELCIQNNVSAMYVATDPDNLAAQQLYESTGGERENIAWYTYRFINK